MAFSAKKLVEPLGSFNKDVNEVIKKKIPAHFNMTKYIRYFYAH